jgi:hypothetical protein
MAAKTASSGVRSPRAREFRLARRRALENVVAGRVCYKIIGQPTPGCLQQVHFRAPRRLNLH